MISCEAFGKKILSLGISTAIGVPDSTLKGIINFFYSSKNIRQITAVNECEAAGIAMGTYMASGKPALCYLQNSGLGKIVNPYTSLIAKEIYRIPLLMLVGWRGRPGEKDEPQHVMMGRIMTDLLDCLELPYTILQDDGWEKQLSDAYDRCTRDLTPYALITPKGLFDDYSISNKNLLNGLLVRETVLETIVASCRPESVFVCTTGKSSRELYEIREKQQETHSKDIYTVGGMGCASSIALGIALQQPERQVICIDGDGAALMQLGTMATIGHYQPDNLLHIIIDNQSYESTGGQPTVSPTVDFLKIADGCGYSTVTNVDSIESLSAAITDSATKNNGVALIIVQCSTVSRKNLGRPTTTPVKNKEDFMEFVGVTHGG